MSDLMDLLPTSVDNAPVAYGPSVLDQFITQDDEVETTESSSNIYRQTLQVTDSSTHRLCGYLVVEYCFTPPNSSDTLLLQLLTAILRNFSEKISSTR
jgi:hypothetical protein